VSVLCPADGNTRIFEAGRDRAGRASTPTLRRWRPAPRRVVSRFPQRPVCPRDVGHGIAVVEVRDHAVAVERPRAGGRAAHPRRSRPADLWNEEESEDQLGAEVTED
jgi:hypothetical protein